MRYERRGPDVASAAPWSRKRRRALAAALTALVALAGVVAGVLVVNGPHKVVVVDALAKPYLAASALIQSLGAPTPVGVSSAAWALSGDRLLHASTAPRLAMSERRWLDSEGRLIPLTAREVASITTSQRLLAASVMTGTLLTSTERQLRSIVQEELGPRPHISSPGGASVATWYSMSEHGDTASVDAAVYTWEQQDTWVDTSAGVKVVTSINQAEVEGRATLKFVGGAWKVETLDQAPYQEAT